MIGSYKVTKCTVTKSKHELEFAAPDSDARKYQIEENNLPTNKTITVYILARVGIHCVPA